MYTEETDYMTVFNDQTILWEGYDPTFNLVTKILTCTRPDDAPDPNIDYCHGGNGEGGSNGSNNWCDGSAGGGLSGHPGHECEMNTSIYAEDGSVKPAENITELFTMFT